MATTNHTGVTVTSGVPDTTAIPLGSSTKAYVIKKTFDFTASALVENDVVQLIPIPDNTLVKQVTVEMITPAVGTTLTVDVGDGAGVDSWDANIDGKAAADTLTHSAIGTDAYAVAASRGKFYSTADTIDMVWDVATDITAGPKFTIYVSCEDYN